MWRNSSATSKRSGKVADGKPALAGDLFQRELFFEVGVDRISRKPQLPRCQPSAHQRPRKMHAAIYLCKMYIQRGRDPIDKLVAGAVVRFDRRKQAVAKVQNNRVAGRNAGPYGKLGDSIGAVIVGKLIESDSWNEEVKAIRQVSGMGRRIKGQVDEADRAMWKGDYLETVFFRYVNSAGISLQGKDDPVLGCRRMVRRTCTEMMRSAESRDIEHAASQRPVGRGNRRLEDKEIAIASSAFQSRDGRIRGSRRYSRICNCQFLQLPLPRVLGLQRLLGTHIIAK